MKAKKLPSGAWRIRVYDYMDAEGKQHYKSFTAPTRAEVNAMAADYNLNKKRVKRGNLTVQECIDKYVEIKSAVLSPTTIRGYKSLACHAYGLIGPIRTDKLTLTDVQLWVNDLSEDHSPKTVHNAYGLFTAAMKLYAPHVGVAATLPKKVPFDGYLPEDADVQKIISIVRGDGDVDLEHAMLLAAFGPLRRGECCALTYKDIVGYDVHVTKAMVRTDGSHWILKQPKTKTSVRTIPFEPEIVNLLGTGDPDERVVKLTPDMVTTRFYRAVARSGLPHFRFHDLRHYAVSLLHAVGIADIYIQGRGGWATSAVMRTVYLKQMSQEAKKANDRANAAFKEVLNGVQNT